MADVTTHGEAADAIIAAVQAAWAANAPAVITPAPALYVGGLAQSVSPEDTAAPAHFARLFVTHMTGEQDAVAARVWCYRGQVLAQVFCVNRAGEGYRPALDLAGVIKDALEGAYAENVVFLRASIREVGGVARFYQVNVYADFEWRHVR